MTDIDANVMTIIGFALAFIVTLIALAAVNVKRIDANSKNAALTGRNRSLSSQLNGRKAEIEGLNAKVAKLENDNKSLRKMDRRPALSMNAYLDFNQTRTGSWQAQIKVSRDGQAVTMFGSNNKKYATEEDVVNAIREVFDQV